MEMQRLTHAGSLLCISRPVSVMWELMMLVWWSRRCHFPSSAAAVTCTSHQRDRSAVTRQLFVYTQSSITARLICTVQGGRRFAANHRAYGGGDGKRSGEGRIQRSKVLSTDGGEKHMSLGKLSEGEIFQGWCIITS